MTPTPPTVRDCLEAVTTRKETLQHRLDEDGQFNEEDVRLLVLGLGCNERELITAVEEHVGLTISLIDPLDFKATPAGWQYIRELLISLTIDGFISGSIFETKRREQETRGA